MNNRVQIALPEDDYKALIKLAVEEDRTVAGQARHMLRRCLGQKRSAAVDQALRPPQSLQGDLDVMGSPDKEPLPG